MRRLDKAKDARRRARLYEKRKAFVNALLTSPRVIPDKRRKPVKHKKPVFDE